MANVINSIKIGTSVGVFAPSYATCTTDATTTAKTATVQNSGNFALETGAIVIVKFSNTNTASTPTLNVKSTGAKPIKYAGETFTDLIAGQLYEFIYDGTSWIVMNPPLVWHTF